MQAEFIRQMFLAWDKYPNKMPIVMFTWLYDRPSSEVEDLLRYYGINDPAFAAYLSSLGLRAGAGAGRDKEAFKVLSREMAVRKKQ